jgi:hypothetical protein
MTIPSAMQSAASIITQPHASNSQPSTGHFVCCARADGPHGGVVVEVAR